MSYSTFNELKTRDLPELRTTYNKNKQKVNILFN